MISDIPLANPSSLPQNLLQRFLSYATAKTSNDNQLLPTAAHSPPLICNLSSMTATTTITIATTVTVTATAAITTTTTATE